MGCDITFCCDNEVANRKLAGDGIHKQRHRGTDFIKVLLNIKMFQERNKNRLPC